MQPNAITLYTNGNFLHWCMRWGAHIKAYTDSTFLKYLNTYQLSSPRQVGWVSRIETFNVEFTPSASSSADMELDSVALESKQSSDLNKRFVVMRKQKQQKRAQKAASTPEADNLPGTGPSSRRESHSRNLNSRRGKMSRPAPGPETRSSSQHSTEQWANAPKLNGAANGRGQAHAGKNTPPKCFGNHHAPLNRVRSHPTWRGNLIPPIREMS